MILNVLGIMSGTSLDGLDLALVSFDFDADICNYLIMKALTVTYPDEISNKIRNAQYSSAFEFVSLHNHFGEFIANQIIENFKGFKIDLIASHGHTIFHYPDKRINFQIGDGARISAITGIPTVCDFRSTDIALNGQGAPLVPVGEKYLFPDFNAFINIGGFSNISIHSNKKIIAFDISPANYALNFFAQKFGKSFDKNGEIGKSGNIDKHLFEKLNNLDFYKIKGSKSLSDHWFFENFLPVCEKFDISNADKLRTIYEHIAFQIAKNFNKYNIKKIMVSGGGAYNTFLIELIRNMSKTEIFIPDQNTIDFKEALIFAFLGLLRFLKKENIFAEVTGSKVNNIGGALYYPLKNKNSNNEN